MQSRRGWQSAACFPPNSRPSNFEDGIELSKDWERQRIAAYFHDQLVPDLMALVFSIEAIRIEVESEKHPAEAKLKEIRDRVSRMLQPIRETTKSSRDRANFLLGEVIVLLKAKDRRLNGSD